ncbi:MAG: hypothetical protein ACRDWT_06420 [Jatrophihabitantaceae bacterium]
MTGRRLTTHALVTGGASCVLLAACLASAVVLGSSATPWVAAVGLAITFAVVRSGMGAAEVIVVREPNRGRQAGHESYPRFDRLLAMLQRAARDRRSFDRVLAPAVRTIAFDLQHAPSTSVATERLRTSLDTPLWALLDPDRPPAIGRPEEPEPPSPAVLAALVGRLEQLERAWR